jgi:DNA-binding NtrC family response regulator
MTTRVLLVDDERNVLSALRRALFDDPYEIMTASSAEEALEIMKPHSFKVVISDERMTGMQGVDFLARVRVLSPETVRILLTGHGTMEAAMKAVNRGGIYRFFTKPWNDLEIRFAVRSAVEKYDLEEENRRLLSTIRSQALEFKVLERRYPGISRVEKDRRGSFVLPDLSEEEVEQLIAECERETGSTE